MRTVGQGGRAIAAARIFAMTGGASAIEVLDRLRGLCRAHDGRLRILRMNLKQCEGRATRGDQQNGESFSFFLPD